MYQSLAESEPILRDVFTGWEDGNGIFYYLESVVGNMPWQGEYGDLLYADLDTAYFGNHSGGKFCSPLVKQFLDDEEAVTEAGRRTIARILSMKYRRNWKRLWDAFVSEYNPIHNYDMVEEKNAETTDEGKKVTDGTLHKSGTDSTAYGKTETGSNSNSSTEMDYLYGLNTDTENPRPSDKITTSSSGTNSTQEGGADTETLNLTDKNDVEENSKASGTEHYRLTRSGNIGVTTTQQMLESEIELWRWNFFDQIFSDLDKELALSVFDSCRV